VSLGMGSIYNLLHVDLSFIYANFGRLFSAYDVRALFCWFWHLLEPHASSTKERNRSRSKKCFILLGFFVGNKFPGKGFRVYWQFWFCFNDICLQFIGRLFGCFYTFSGVRANLHLFRAYLRLFFVDSLFI
jgi:hypothetical protein